MGGFVMNKELPNTKTIIKRSAIVIIVILLCLGFMAYKNYFNQKRQREIDESTISSMASEEMDIEETESEKSKEESETNIIFQKEFLVDNQRLTLFLSEEDENLEINAWGNADTEEKATLMLVVFISAFDDLNIDYSIFIMCGEKSVLYSKSAGSIIVSGSNKDGSPTLSMPDWVVSEFTMSEEELNNYSAEILTDIKEFGEELGK